uniref:Uncharacterized protein n=1 Tax=Anguilla anguilla TaxID=7936 RepID=A0A0E9W7M1_ANGAN
MNAEELLLCIVSFSKVMNFGGNFEHCLLRIQVSLLRYQPFISLQEDKCFF